MAKAIRLTPSELTAQGQEMNSLKQEYESLFQGVANVLNDTNANWSKNLSNNFSGKITMAQNSFGTIVELLETGASSALDCATSFNHIDFMISQKLKSFADVTSVILDVVDGSEEETSVKDDVYSVVDTVIGYLGAGANGLDNDALANVGSLLGLVENVSKAVDEFSVSSYLSVVKNVFSTGGKLLDSDYLGLGGDVFDFLSEGIESIKNADPIEFLKNADGYIEATTGLTWAIDSLFNITKTASAAAAQNALTSVNTIGSMATHLVGDVWSALKDGNFSFQDFADTTMDVGVHGGTALVKGLTLGLLNIDAEEAMQTYQKNTDIVTDYLAETNLPLWAQCTAGVLSSPVQFVVSTGEIVCDTIAEPLKAIEKGVTWGLNWGAEKLGLA